MQTLLDHPSLAELKREASTDGGEWCGACPRCGGHDRFHVWPNKGPSGKFWCRAWEQAGFDVTKAAPEFVVSPRL